MPTAVKRALKVFLCHASGDKPAVRDLYKRLVTEGVDAWLDQEKLLPGQDWRGEIPRAVHEADVVVICLSKNSITKEGYVQKEIKFALDLADEKPEGTIFLIPARLEDCVVPERLSRWQWVDLYEENGFIKLLRSMKLRADAVGATVEPTSYVDPDKELERKLEQLYTEGLAAFYTEDWDKACQRFQAILSERPNHKNAAEKLEDAKQQRNLAKLYGQATDAVRSENLETAIQTLEELSRKSADYKDTVQLLRDARQQKQLRELYSEARTLHAAQKWHAVVKVFEQISGIDSNYPDADGLLLSARKEVAELERLARLNDQYNRALREMDAGNWYEARKTLERIHKTQVGFLETEKLLRKAEDEILREETKRKQSNQINTLYEQAHGLLRSKKWRNALEKLEQIRKLDDNFQDTDGIAEKAQRELARDEKEAEHQNQLAALYAEAVSLLKEEKYQEALDQWQKVKAIDPKYPDRQGVQSGARKKLTGISNTIERGKNRFTFVPKTFFLVLSLAALILAGVIGISIFIGQPPVLPECISMTGNDPILLMAKFDSSPVLVDGKITYPTEWENARCYQLNLVPMVAPGSCDGDSSIYTTWHIKNDDRNLFLLVKIQKSNFLPSNIQIPYFYNYYQNSDNTVLSEEPLDQFGWDPTKWEWSDDASDGGVMNTKAGTSQDKQSFWYEISKPLDSGDAHDWKLKPGDLVGSGITDDHLIIGSWGSSSSLGDVFFCRYIQLQLAK